jgi:hypothetical protein
VGSDVKFRLAVNHEDAGEIFVNSFFVRVEKYYHAIKPL